MIRGLRKLLEMALVFVFPEINDKLFGYFGLFQIICLGYYQNIPVLVKITSVEIYLLVMSYDPYKLFLLVCVTQK